MGFFDFLKPKNKIKNNISPTQAFVSGDDFPIIDVTDNELKLSAVFSAITTISSTMSKIPFFIINTNTKERIYDPNINRLINLSPNGIMNAKKMNELIMIWTLIDGEAFVVPVRKDRSLEIIKRIPYKKSDVTKRINKETYEMYYDIVCKDGKTRTYSANEVEHYMAFTIDGIDGISPLDYAQKTVEAGLGQDEYNSSTIRQGTRPTEYITVATDLGYREQDCFVGTDEKGNPIHEKMLPQEFLRRQFNKGKKNGTLVLDKGMTYNTIQPLTPEQMQFVTSKDVTVQDIARFFRMGSCMFKLGVGKQSYNTNEQGQICYINEAIAPYLRDWEQELTLKLLTAEQRAKGWQIKGNLNAELRGDTAARLSWYKGMHEMGVYDINEIRDYEDLSGIGELGDVRTIGPNAVPLEKAVNGETAGQATPNPISEENSVENKIGNQSDWTMDGVIKILELLNVAGEGNKGNALQDGNKTNTYNNETA